MPLQRALPSPGGGSSGSVKVKTLEKLAIDVYLKYLEDACAVYIRLCCSESKLLQFARDNMIQVLKDQLRSNLSGIMSTSIRQEMIREVKNSGRFPSTKFHNQYQCESNVSFDSDSDRNVMDEIKKHSSLCSSGNLFRGIVNWSGTAIEVFDNRFSNNVSFFWLKKIFYK